MGPGAPRLEALKLAVAPLFCLRCLWLIAVRRFNPGSQGPIGQVAAGLGLGGPNHGSAEANPSGGHGG